MFDGFQMLPNRFLTEDVPSQSRYPRSAKKRIMKKFAKKYATTKTVPSADVIVDQLNHVIYGHPETLKKLAIVRGVPAPVLSNLIKDLPSMMLPILRREEGDAPKVDDLMDRLPIKPIKPYSTKFKE